MTALAADTQLLYESLGYAADADTSGQLLAWLDGIGQLLQALDNLCRDGTDINGNPAPGWSQVLDINRCPTYVLPWLAQFVGGRIDPTQPDAAQRAAIEAESGFQRGTPPVLVAIAQQYLAGSQRVDIYERTTDAYHLQITVYQAQLAGMTYGALSAAYPTYTALGAAFATYAAFSVDTSQLTVALLAALPAGLVAAVVIAVGGSYGQLSAAYPNYSQLAPRFGTYNPMTDWVPGT